MGDGTTHPSKESELELKLLEVLASEQDGPAGIGAQSFVKRVASSADAVSMQRELTG
jgi:hypothetical protein